MYSSAFGAAARIVSRSPCRASRLSLGRAARYSSMVLGLAMALTSVGGRGTPSGHAQPQVRLEAHRGRVLEVQDAPRPGNGRFRRGMDEKGPHHDDAAAAHDAFVG